MTITAENITDKKVLSIMSTLEELAEEVDTLSMRVYFAEVSPQEAAKELAEIKERIDKAFEA